VVIYPDYKKPFKLTADASEVGLGAVLSQDQGRGDQPVAYASKVNSTTVANYSISELECLAVVWAVRLFRPHLYGRRFTIVTDHIALKWLMTTKEPAGRLHRWALTLQEYDFDILHRPGRENHVADALSRGPVAETSGGEAVDTEADEPAIGSPVQLPPPANILPSTGATTAGRMTLQKLLATTEEPEATAKVEALHAAEYQEGTVEQEVAGEVTKEAVEAELVKLEAEMNCAAAIRRVDSAELGVVQFTDVDIQREQAKSAMVRKLRERGSYRGRRVCDGEDGLVHVDVEPGQTRILLPAVYWALAFKEAHDSIWTGHLRGPQTNERLRRLYWWPEKGTTVSNWVAACQDCGSRKARPKAVVPPLRSVRTGDVCDRWAIAVAGLLPVTANGNTT